GPCFVLFFFSSRRRHTRFSRDWSSDVCSSDLSGASWTIFEGTVQLAPRPRPRSVHERSAAKTRPSASTDTAPAPATNGHCTHHWPSGQTLMIELLCSCANSSPPSSAAVMPSTIIGPDPNVSHGAPPETTPGTAAMSTVLSGAG